MAKYEILGGSPLRGSVTISGAKNAAVAILPAAILIEGKCRVENVPDISDVRILLDILEDLGAVVERLPEGTVTIDCTHIKSTHHTQRDHDVGTDGEGDHGGKNGHSHKRNGKASRIDDTRIKLSVYKVDNSSHHKGRKQTEGRIGHADTVKNTRFQY